MVQVQIDSKGRVLIPKELREDLELEEDESVNIFVKDKNHLVLEKLKTKKQAKEDPLDWLLKHPAHVDPKLVTKEALEKIRENMWYP